MIWINEPVKVNHCYDRDILLNVNAFMPGSCVNCSYRETGCLQHQRSEAVANFSALLTRYAISGKGKVIFNQGELVTGQYFLCQGIVKLVRCTEHGKEVIVDCVTPCSVIGGMSMLGDEQVRIVSAVTVTERTEVAVLGTPKLLDLLRRHPELGISFYRHMSDKVREGYRWIAGQSLPARERVLFLLARVIAKLQPREGKWELPCSSQELAQFAQVTPETMSRVMRGLEKEGVIRKDKTHLWILKKEAVEPYLGEG